jgi:pimeloyl-ACP methyl ester carboxylesterase
MAEDVIGILDEYGLKQAHVMGMSLGGYIAQILALKYPDRVQSLTLIGSEPLGWDGAPLPNISQEFLDHFSALSTLDWSDQTQVADFLLQSERLSAGPGQDFDEQRMRARIQQILSRTESPASMFNHAMVQTNENWNGRFREIRVPVLVIHGEEDPILPVENGQAIASGIADSQLLVLPGTAHELPLSQVAIITERVAAHVSD